MVDSRGAALGAMIIILYSKNKQKQKNKIMKKKMQIGIALR